MDALLIQRLDDLVEKGFFRDRNEAVQEAVSEKISRMNTTALTRECFKLDPKEEQELANEGLAADLASWPKY
jgi:Arc/MetJ-type ribon-helix-helix transcriptional regulator